MVIAAAQVESVPGDVAKNVAHHVMLATAAAEQGVGLLVFPELSLIGYELELARDNVIRADDARLDPLRRVAAEARMTLVAGAPVPDDAGRLHIAALAFGPDGSLTKYSKVHVHESELHVFAPGPGGAALRMDGDSVALGICRDATFPEHAAAAASAGAHVYAVGVMITEDDYARKTGLLRGYALEHGMMTLMANYRGWTGGWLAAGKSAIWSRRGDVLAAASVTGEALVVASGEVGRVVAVTARGAAS